MCKAPLARAEKLGETYINKKGGISYKCDFFSWRDFEENPQYYKMKYKKVDMIPCGQCVECRLNHARDKANQMILEKAMYPEEECWFITLTYSDENIPFHKTCNVDTGEIKEGVSLDKSDAQKFIKRLRDNYQRKYNVPPGYIRYVLVGEYGSNTHRPHYHAIIYGLPLDQTKLKKYKINELGQTIWTHKEIESIWGKGFVSIGRVTWESCCYVARYMMKKQYGNNKWYYNECGCIPEFITQSLKPAIGRNYLLENLENIQKTDEIPIVNKSTLQKVKPPKSFDNYMKEHFPELFEKTQEKRKKMAESAERIKNMLTDLDSQERRVKDCERIEERAKALIRKEI